MGGVVGRLCSVGDGEEYQPAASDEENQAGADGNPPTQPGGRDVEIMATSGEFHGWPGGYRWLGVIRSHLLIQSYKTSILIESLVFTLIYHIFT